MNTTTQGSHQDTHQVPVGYVLWFLGGLVGYHRFYYGRPLTGLLWMLTLGLAGIGWIVDAFLIPGMNRDVGQRLNRGGLDYTTAWLLFMFLGFFGAHRFYMSKIGTGVLYLLTFGLLGLGVIYDLFTLNTQVSQLNCREAGSTSTPTPEAGR